MSSPPSSLGEVKDTVIDPSPAVTSSIVGRPGTSAAARTTETVVVVDDGPTDTTTAIALAPVTRSTSPEEDPAGTATPSILTVALFAAATGVNFTDFVRNGTDTEYVRCAAVKAGVSTPAETARAVGDYAKERER